MIYATRTLTLLVATLLVTPDATAHGIDHDMRSSIDGDHLGESPITITSTSQNNQQCWNISAIIDIPAREGANDPRYQATMGVYRAHATNNGNHVNHEQDPLGYAGDIELYGDWERQPQYLATVNRVVVNQRTSIGDYILRSTTDCPPANMDGYRYVLYTIERLEPFNCCHNVGTCNENTGGYYWNCIESNARHAHLNTYIAPPNKFPLPNTSALTPNFYTHTSTADRILFTYYTYQFADTLKTHQQLRKTLLGALFPDATDRQLLDAIDSDLRFKAADDE